MNTVDVLDLASGKTRTVLSGDYSPSNWLDDHRLIVETSVSNTADYYLFDTNNGSQQKLINLPHIASLTAPGSLPEGDIARSSNSSQIFISSFVEPSTNTPGCQGTATQGPGTLKSYTINGGSTHTIYSDQNHAIMVIQPVDARTLLIYIENTIGDLSQNGLWKIKSDGTGLTRLTSANDPRCRDTGYREWAPKIAQNDQSYALLQTDFNHDENQSIVAGNLSGGTPTPIATGANVALPRGKAHFDRFLQLVGMI
jgi:eukaryotic-like serine/threonine-protein kinase